MSKKTRNFWIEAVILILLIVAGAVAFTISLMAPLNKDDLKIQAGDLRSFAAAGRLLAIQFSRGETTETFFQNQTELIEDKASAAESSLRDAKTKPELRQQLAETTSLAHQLSETLNKMHGGSDADALAAELDSLTHQLSTQEDRLK
jgi:hypothetical protein